MRAPRTLPAWAVVAVVVAIALSGCDTERELGDARPASTLVVSTAYTPDAGDGAGRAAALRETIGGLREATASGWVGRQDDVTGYLTELSGGRYAPDGAGDAPAVVTAFMDAYGEELFGVGGGSIDLGQPTPPLSSGGASTLQAAQTVDGVPVLDASLAFTVGSAETDPRLNAVRGRVYPGLSVDPDPTIAVARARTIAAGLSGGSVVGTPRLVVVPGGTGRLSWELTVVGIVSSQGDSGGLAEGTYYIDADTGDLVQLRRADGDVAPLAPVSWRRTRPQAVRVRPLRVGELGTRAVTTGVGVRAPTPGQSVELSGAGPLGQQLSAVGTRTGAGTLLLDKTTPWYDAATGTGAIETFDMRGSDDQSALPGKAYVAPRSGAVDPDALAAQAYSTAVEAYYAGLGRAGYDGVGGTLRSSVNFAGGDFCNAFFTSALQQMVYGNPCTGPNGDAQLVSIDVAAHEITHGVTGSSANLIYSGQSGAMNEAFSDYFGNVIGNLVKGTDDSTIGEDLCSQVTGPQTLCGPVDDTDTLALRQMLNANTVDDYVKLLDPGARLTTLGAIDQDNGGVHINSAIWNNALWQIRSQLAKVDDTTGNDSALAQDFDKIVFYTLTTQLGPAAGFVDGRAAIEQTIKDAGADPVVLRVAQQVFDQNLICAGCPTTTADPGVGVAVSPATQVTPAVHGDQVAWVDVGTEGLSGTATTAPADATDAAATGVADGALQIVFAGDATVTLDGSGAIVRATGDGPAETLAQEDPDETIARGLAGSDDGAAWYSYDADAIRYVDAAGKAFQVSTADYAQPVLSLGAGDGTVSAGTADGRVLLWKPGGKLTQVGSMPSTVLSVASYGARVVAVDDQGHVAVFTGGKRTELSDAGYPLGAAMSEDYTVWSQQIGTLSNREGDTGAPDTDLYLYSFATGKIYDVIDASGQQGFPAVSGARLAWQDAVNGGDDIYSAELPPDL